MRKRQESTMADSMILLWRRYLRDFTAINPHMSNKLTIELIMALAFAKRCLSNPRSTSSFTLDNKTTAENTIIENANINQRAVLSFFVIEGCSNCICQTIFESLPS